MTRAAKALAITLAVCMATAVQAEPSAMRQNASSAPKPVLDFTRWKTKDSSQATLRERALLYRLSVAELPYRQPIRWALARHYISEDSAADALGVLSSILRNDPQVESQRVFRALRGYAHYRLGHHAAALADLGQVSLDGEGQVWLLRASLAESRDNCPESVAAWSRGSTAIALLPAVDQLSIRFALARCAIELKQARLAAEQLAAVSAKTLSKRQAAEYDFLHAKLASLNGKPELSDYYSAKVLASGDRKIMLQAQLADIQSAYARKRLTNSQAIDKLNALRLSWRGDKVEQELLQTLGERYLEAKQWRPALTTLRQAVSYFPASDRTRSIQTRMRAVFADLFTHGEAEKLLPVEAFALFSDFRDLAPLGDAGDGMIRQLSDRLIQAGLPDRAAGLLEYQVRYRLTGTSQAVVAIRAALVDLMANRPTAALDILRITRQNDMADDVRATRGLVEARALIQLGQYESALDLIEDDKSRTANQLRFDAYWRAKQWRQLQKHLSETYSGSGPPARLRDQQQIIRWAFALAMDGSQTERDLLQRQFGAAMRKSPYSMVFTLLTSAQQIDTALAKRLASTLADIDKLMDLSHLYHEKYQTTKQQKPTQSASMARPVQLAAK